MPEEIWTPDKYPCCGLHVPTKEEVDALGIERHAVHPKWVDDPELNAAVDLELDKDLRGLIDTTDEIDTRDQFMVRPSRIGRIWRVPPGTPQGRRAWPPYHGAARGRAWSGLTRVQVKRIRRKAPGVLCATYKNHGRTGMPWGIDVMVAPFRQRATRVQENFGDRLVNWAIRNWNWLNLNYIIWWDWMNDGAGWFSYTPWSKPASQGGWPFGDPDQDTREHRDHAHFQIDNPFVAGNE